VIKANLDRSLKPYVMKRGWQISSDSLCKLKSAAIGTYVGYEIANIKLDGEYYPVLYYIIKPNKKALMIDDYISDLYKLPNGYVDSDSTFYVRIIDIGTNESKTFRKVK
jgi:hypothetical protein